MAEYIPIFVKDDAELEQAIQLKRTVIVVTNKSIYDSIQQQAAKGKKKENKV